MPSSSRPDNAASQIKQSNRPQRVRTADQLTRKRQDDRISKKNQRAENKIRMEKMEKDMNYIKQCITGWDFLFQCSPLSAIQMVRLSPREHSIATEPKYCNSEAQIFVDCRCGIEHIDRSSCLEYSISSVLFRTHLTQEAPKNMPFPRNPSLANILGYGGRVNVLVSALEVISTVAGQLDTGTHFGLYFLCYRLLRWRLYPDYSMITDVPVWLQPTQIQESIPHPVAIDFIPWPGLRNYMCLNQNQDSRHSVALFVSSLRLRWPKSEQLICKLSDGHIGLNSKLEDVASDLACWQMVSPWLDVFPNLAEYLSTTDQKMN